MIGGMLSTLKGGTLWAVVAIILAVIGATTYLASQAILSGSDMLTLITLILTGVVGVTASHVAGQTAAAAFNTPASAPSVPPAPSAGVGAGVSPPPVPAPAPAPAMPTAVT